MASFLIRAALATAIALVAGPALAQGDAPGVSTAKVASPATGEQVYVQVCQACHMADAKGGSGAGTIPALAGNPRLAAAGYPIVMILKGRGAMPSLADMLNPAQIADVTKYIRTHFGNSYPASITAADVARMAGAKQAP